jgi:hypothetical protein
MAKFAEAMETAMNARGRIPLIREPPVPLAGVRVIFGKVKGPEVIGWSRKTSSFYTGGPAVRIPVHLAPEGFARIEDVGFGKWGMLCAALGINIAAKEGLRSFFRKKPRGLAMATHGANHLGNPRHSCRRIMWIGAMAFIFAIITGIVR